MIRRHQYLKGITTVELMVSAIVLLGIMSFVGSLTVRINGVWKDIVQRRVAVCELTNQLEHLTLSDEKKIEQKIDSLQPSVHCRNSLRNAKLSATIRDDQLGKRIVLAINWDRTHAGKPVELSGWLPNSESEAKDGIETNDGDIKKEENAEEPAEETSNG